MYPLFRVKWPYALNVFKFFFVVLNHLASPILQTTLLAIHLKLGHFLNMVTQCYARAASAITSWNAVCSITCRLGSQEKNAIRQACTYCTSWSGMHLPLSFLTYPTTFMFQHAESKRHHCNRKHTASITFHFRICHVTYKIDLSTSTKNKGSVSPELTWTFEI